MRSLDGRNIFQTQALYQVLELPDVPWPVVTDEEPQAILREPGRRIRAGSKLAAIVFQQRRDVLFALSQRRNLNAGDIQPKIEILAKEAAPGHAFQILVGCRYE